MLTWRILTRPSVLPREPPHLPPRWCCSCWAQHPQRSAGRPQARIPPLYPPLYPTPSLSPARSCDQRGSCTFDPTLNTVRPWAGMRPAGPQLHYGPHWHGKVWPPPSSHLYSAESETFVKVSCCFLWVENKERALCVCVREIMRGSWCVTDLLNGSKGLISSEN